MLNRNTILKKKTTLLSLIENSTISKIKTKKQKPP